MKCQYIPVMKHYNQLQNFVISDVRVYIFSHFPEVRSILAKYLCFFNILHTIQFDGLYSYRFIPADPW